MNNKNINIKMGLLDNGTHSLKRGYEIWKEWEKNKNGWLLKEAIIWVHHGIELLLKQLLVQNNEFLVFQDVNKAVERLGILRKKQGMNNAGVLDLFDHDDKVTSIGFINLIDRVAITLSIDELDTKSDLRSRIDELTKLRNKIVHFSIELDVVGVSGLISDILEPLLDLLSREIHCDHFKKVSVLEIRKVAQPVQEYLKYIRAGIVSNAISATEKARNTNNKAGIVRQVLGSGLSMTLMSYIERVKTLAFFREKTIFIITDRSDIAEKIYHQIANNQRVFLYKGKNDTNQNEILHNNKHIIIATEQRLVSERFLFNDNCLLIGFKTTTNKYKLEKCFPFSTRILFTNTPINDDQYFFGELIQEYDLLQAYQDEILKPFTIKQINDIENQFIESINHHAKFNFLAEKIVEDFESKANQKAIIVVDTIHNIDLILKHILNLRPQWNIDGYEHIQKISPMENINLIKKRLAQFFDQSNSLSILVGTSSYFAGFDSILVSTVYLTCPISFQLSYHFSNLVSRSTAFEQHGEIVDFVGLDWAPE